MILLMDSLKRPEFRLNWLKIVVCALFFFNLLSSSARPVFAQEIPAGFRLIAQQQGVSLYRKDYPNGTPDYVQIVNLTQGGSIDLLYGAPVAMNNQRNRGMFGGPNPSFQQKRIQTYWNEYSSSQADAFCVTNGQFFYMPESPTPLALPLLVDHQLLAEGFGYPQYPEKQLMLVLWSGHADILPLTPENLASTTAKSVIGGLTEEANKKPKNSVGRTFMGIWDQDGDQLNETIAIYTTQTATQPEAARTVRSFGASKVMMLDGGGSTQLICQGQTYIDTTRAIPQAIGVSAGFPEINELESQAVEKQPIVPPEMAISPEFLGPVTNSNLETPEDISESVAASAENGSLPPQPSSAEQSEPPIEATAQVPAPITASLSLPSAGFIQTSTNPAGIAAEIQRSTSLTTGYLSSVAGQSSGSSQANGLDVLWLPAIISPISVLLILVVRRQIFFLYRE